MAQLDSLLLLCGHYEGVDQRALDMCIDEELSIGDYVLTGGELGALVTVDAVARLVPGVLGCGESGEDEILYHRPAGIPAVHAPRRFSRAKGARGAAWRQPQRTFWRGGASEVAGSSRRMRRPEMLAAAPLDEA